MVTLFAHCSLHTKLPFSVLEAIRDYACLPVLFQPMPNLTTLSARMPEYLNDAVLENMESEHHSDTPRAAPRAQYQP